MSGGIDDLIKGVIDPSKKTGKRDSIRRVSSLKKAKEKEVNNNKSLSNLLEMLDKMKAQTPIKSKSSDILE